MVWFHAVNRFVFFFAVANEDTYFGRNQGICLCELDHPFFCLQKPSQENTAIGDKVVAEGVSGGGESRVPLGLLLLGRLMGRRSKGGDGDAAARSTVSYCRISV